MHSPMELLEGTRGVCISGKSFVLQSVVAGLGCARVWACSTHSVEGFSGLRAGRLSGPYTSMISEVLEQSPARACRHFKVRMPGRFLAVLLLAATACVVTGASRSIDQQHGDTALSAAQLNPAAPDAIAEQSSDRPSFAAAAAASGPLRKRGVGSTHLTLPELAALKGLAWWYSWGPRVWNDSVAAEAAATGVEFVPMQAGLLRSCLMVSQTCSVHLVSLRAPSAACTASGPGPRACAQSRQRVPLPLTVPVSGVQWLTLCLAAHALSRLMSIAMHAVGPRGRRAAGHLAAARQPGAAGLQ